MIVSQFQSWARTASPPSRADGVSALARAYLYSDLDPAQRREARLALTAFLDDPSPLVRRALADAVASAADAPHHIVLALTEDQPSIAAIVLSRSPILSDAELVDRATDADEVAQRAIAARPNLSAAVATVLAASAGPAALVLLADNPGADLPASAIRRMVARHGERAELREALLARGGLPIDVRTELLAATAGALAAFVTRRDWMSAEHTKRVTRDAMEKATIAIAAASDREGEPLGDLVAHLRATGQLTVAFTLRALLSANHALFVAILGNLADMPGARVAGLVRHFESGGFAALYRKAGLPACFLPAFRIALAALERCSTRWTCPTDGKSPAFQKSGASPRPKTSESCSGKALRERDDVAESGTALSLDLVEHVLAGCIAIDDGSLDKLVMLLRRFETEAAREAARARRSARADAPGSMPMIAAPPVSRAQRDEMMLAAIDFDEAVPVARAVPMAEPQPARFTIDLAAIEAELIAA